MLIKANFGGDSNKNLKKVETRLGPKTVKTRKILSQNEKSWKSL